MGDEKNEQQPVKVDIEVPQAPQPEPEGDDS